MAKFARKIMVVSALATFSACAVSDHGAGPSVGVKEVMATGTGDNAPTPAAASGAAGSAGDTRTCAERSSQARALVDDALTHSGLDCAEDSDCDVVPTHTHCSSGCASLTNRAGADAIAAAIERAEATICDPAGACPTQQVPCPSPPGNGYGSCIAGTCVAGAPARWDSFSIDRQKAPAFTSTSPKCSVDDCTIWTVSANGEVAITTPRQSTNAQLSAADLATVDGILRSATLRMFGWGVSDLSCDLASGDLKVHIVVVRDGGKIGQDITGCALSGPAGNAFQKLYDTIRAY